MRFVCFRSATACLSVCSLAFGVALAEVPKDVQAVLTPAFERTQQAKHVEVQARQSGGVKLNGKLVQQLPDAVLTIHSASPNQLIISAGNEQKKEVPVVSDGNHLFFTASETAYLRLPAPKDFGTITEAMLVSFGPMDSVLLPVSLAGANATEVVFDDVNSAEIIDREKHQDRPAAHVKLVDDEAVWEFWVSTDDSPEVLKIQADLSKGVRQANPQIGENDKLEFIVVSNFSAWKVNGEPKEDAFKFVPPAGAEGYDSVEELQAAMQGPPPLLGEEAPAFKLATLDGKEFDLAAHKGKDVVILDFWATWCGPCRKGLPVLAGVAKTMASKGVVAYAVNLQETPEEINAFLKEFPLEIGIALDSEAAVASKFKVQGIPHSVLIGKDGLVQAVHVGFSDEDAFKAQLTEELETLIAGKSLLKSKKKDDAPKSDEKTPAKAK
jgi:thiol-disulfide isomerase/thioredoxin